MPRPLSWTCMVSKSRWACSATVIWMVLAPAASEFIPTSRMCNDSSSNILLQFLLAEARDFVRRQFAVNVVTDGHRRRQRAGADAARAIQAEQIVLGGFAFADAELLSEPLQDHFRAADMARRAGANEDLVFAPRHHGEEMVKCDHAINLRQRHLQRRGDIPQHVGTEVTE